MMINTNLKSNRRMLNANLVKEEIRLHELEHGKMSRDELLTYLFGNYSEYPQTHFDLYIMVKKDQKWWHRLNMLWAFPLTVICIPYMWITQGEIGWTNKNIIGGFVLRSIGEDS